MTYGRRMYFGIETTLVEYAKKCGITGGKQRIMPKSALVKGVGMSCLGKFLESFLLFMYQILFTRSLSFPLSSSPATH